MTNVFRPEYRELNEEEKKLIDEIKTRADELFKLFDSAIQEDPSPKGRYIALAKTDLESSVMWAVKGVTL